MRPDERRKFFAEHIGNDPDNWTPEDLSHIANGPIMDPCKLYLPAGKISLAEAKLREAAMVEVVRLA